MIPPRKIYKGSSVTNSKAIQPLVNKYAWQSIIWGRDVAWTELMKVLHLSCGRDPDGALILKTNNSWVPETKSKFQRMSKRGEKEWRNWRQFHPKMSHSIQCFEDDSIWKQLHGQKIVPDSASRAVEDQHFRSLWLNRWRIDLSNGQCLTCRWIFHQR